MDNPTNPLILPLNSSLTPNPIDYKAAFYELARLTSIASVKLENGNVEGAKEYMEKAFELCDKVTGFPAFTITTRIKDNG